MRTVLSLLIPQRIFSGLDIKRTWALPTKEQWA